MGAIEDQVFTAVNVLTFLFGVATPKQEDHAFPFAVDGFNDFVCKGFPAFALVGTRLALDDGQNTVKQ